jgi:plastocyanin
MKNQVFLNHILGISLIIAICSGTPIWGTIHTVNMVDFAFTPAKTVVSPGDTVKWVFSSGFAHSSVSDGTSPKAWSSGTLSIPGQSFSLQFTAGDGPGPFPYHCGVHPFTMKDTIFMNVPAPPTIYSFVLDEGQANNCAGTGSSAVGYGLAILHDDSTKLSLWVKHSVSGADNAHVHLGAPCVEGGVEFAFSSFASPIYETWNVTPADVANLIAGDLYVNIHSPSFPSGEIRGQIVQQPIKFIFTLNEDENDSLGGNNSFANGLSVCELNATSTQLSVKVTHDVANTIDSHIHLGAPGVNGAIQFAFANSQSPVDEVWDLDTTSVRNLLDGKLYINIHSTLYPAGEIRGQIEREKILIPYTMDEAQSGGTGSSATGFVVFTLSADQKTIDVYAEHDVASTIDGHVHYGAPGVGGPIAFGFSNPMSPISETWNITPADVDSLFAGKLYVNIHSTPFPSGEIRGQALPYEEHAYSFKLTDDQANGCLGTGSSAIGNATAILKKGGRELTISLTHNVVNPIDGHIHFGDSCVASGAIVFGFTSPVSPVNDIWYLPDSSVTNLFQVKLYANVHSMAFPAEEIRGQIVNPSFLCGDVNASGIINVADAVYLVQYIFASGPAPNPLASGDVNCSGIINVADAVYLVQYIFAGGPAPCASCK